MLIALISDVHGNLVALEAVLDRIERVQPDVVACLGDLAASGPRPRECIESVLTRAQVVVAGNSDAWLAEPVLAEPASEKYRMIQEIDLWVRDALRDHHLRSLGDLPRTESLALPDGSELLFCHGSPRSFHDPLESITPDAEVDAMLEGCRADLVAAGHTHQPMLRRHRSQLLVNPGSVGMPVEYRRGGDATNPPWAEIALVRAEATGVSLCFDRVPLDPQRVVADAYASGMPHPAFWTSGW